MAGRRSASGLLTGRRIVSWCGQAATTGRASCSPAGLISALTSVAADGGTAAPDAKYVAGGGDVGGGVAVHQQQVGRQSGGDAAAVGQGEAAGGCGGGGVQRLGRAEPGVDEECQLLVQAGAVGRAGGGCVAAGQQRDAGVGEGTD